MSEPAKLRRYLVDCSAHRLRPSFERHDAKLWVVAFDHLLAQSDLEAAAFAAPWLEEAFPAIEYFRRMSAILRRMPPPCTDRTFADFRHRQEADVEIVPRKDAATVVFAFGGRFGGMGMPAPLLHRWFGQVRAHVVYLRDRASATYEHGIGPLAASLAGAVTSLKRTAGELGAGRLVTYGNSLGGYGALRYALELPASSALVFGALTNLTEAFNAARVDGRARFPAGVDLAPLFAASPARPRVRLVYGVDNADDALHAANLAGIDGVTLEPLAEYSGHEPILRAVQLGKLGDYLHELVEA